MWRQASLMVWRADILVLCRSRAWICWRHGCVGQVPTLSKSRSGVYGVTWSSGISTQYGGCWLVSAVLNMIQQRVLTRLQGWINWKTSSCLLSQRQTKVALSFGVCLFVCAYLSVYLSDSCISPPDSDLQNHDKNVKKIVMKISKKKRRLNKVSYE